MTGKFSQLLGLLLWLLSFLLLFGKSLGSIQFTVQPQNTITGHNQPLLVPCSANTTLAGTLYILWRVNLTWIVDYQNKHFRQLQNHSLYFDRFLPSDQGVYQCSAMVQDSQHNHLGQIYSNNAIIKLAYINDKFSLDPQSSSVLLGTSLTLQCLTPKSEPIPDIYWEKDGNRISSQQIGILVLKAESVVSSTVLLKNLSLTDTGSYRCVASNRLIPSKIIRSNSAAVSIAAKQERPYFEKRPNSVIASRNQPFTWPCLIRGIPQPSIQWYRNGQLVPNETNRFMLSTGPLHFVSVREEYNGLYTCQGSNTLGTISSNPPEAFVVAFIDYIFEKDPNDTVVNAGQQLVLRCKPPRTIPANLQIKWYKDYASLTPTGDVAILSDGSLQVNSVTKAYEGTYFCEAQNPITSEKRTSKKAVVTVRVTTYIHPTFSNVSAIIGQFLTVTCQASGSPAPTVRWQRNSKIVSQNETLTFTKINITDTGYYKCIASNPAGTASRRLFVDVFTIPQIVKAPSNKTKNTGQTAEFICDVVGIPKPIVTWYFKSRTSAVRHIVVLDSRVTKSPPTLKISALRNSDEGEYICVANSTAGYLQASAWLIVHVPPTFTTLPSNKTTVQSATVTFHCSASGDPLPSVTWYYNAALLTSGPKYDIFSGSLTVKNTVVSDFGWYTCKVSNVAGNLTAKAYMDVQVKPSINDFSVPTQVRSGSNFSVTCKGTGNPTPVLRWRRNSTFDLVVDGTHIRQREWSLDVIGARASDSGLYECILTNSLGVARRQNTLTVQVLPNPPKSLTASSIQSMSVAISWSPGFDGHSPTLNYKLEISRKAPIAWSQYAMNIAASRKSYSVYGLEPFTAYLFRMQAVTSIGQSGYSAVLEVKTLESAPSSPLNVTVRIQNATAVVLTWHKPTSSHGIITLYQIQYGIIDSLVQVTMNITVNQLPTYHLTINQLRPFSTYYFRLRAAVGSNQNLKWGNLSNVVYANMPATAPSSAPIVLNVTAVSSTSIRVIFKKLSQMFANGILTGHRVMLSGNDNHSQITNNTEVTFTGLGKFSLYKAIVSACNHVACGPYSFPVTVRTMEDFPSEVMNFTAVSVSGQDIYVTWKPPLYPNGILTGYAITIKGLVYYELITLHASTHSLQKGQLVPNNSYVLSISASTKVGFGPESQNITVKLGPVIIKSSPRPWSTSKPTEPTTKLISSTKAKVNSTTAAVKTGVPVKKIDWLNSDNLPILIGVGVTILVLFVAVLILVTIMCTRRIKRGIDKRDRWISTRTQSGSDNPVFNENRDVELTRKDTTKSQRMSGPAPSRVEIPVAEKNVDLDDFLFEEESVNQAENVNPSNDYAFDETIRLKGNEDKSPLVKLRNNPIDLGDDASDYDTPYTEVGELGEPFSKDLFAFIDEEEKRSLSQDSSQGSMEKEKSQSDDDFSSNMDDKETNPGLESQTDGQEALVRPDTTDVGEAKDLTWDPYDTSKAAGHAENAYDVPEIEVTKPSSPDVEYAEVNKKPKQKDDKVKLINDSVFIYDERTDL